MFCSVIIPTIGRPSLSKTVHSVLDQTFVTDDFEVIVVNDSGKPLPKADWQRSERVRTINTNKRERSMARNTGAAVAKGKYLHFLDDDDWLLPDGMDSLWALAQRSGDAIWLYGGVKFVDSTGKHLGNLNLGKRGNCFVETVAKVWIPVQASLVDSKAFFEVGGFRQPPSEDLELCRRIALRGDFANTSAPIACILRGTSWGSSSADTMREIEVNRWRLDKILDEPGSLLRLYASANSSSFWHGRVFHAYMSAVLLHLRNKNFISAASRVVLGVASLVLAGYRVLFPDFWRALRTNTITHYLITNPSPDYESIGEWLN